MDWSKIIYEIEDKVPLSGSLATILGVRYQYISDLKMGKTKIPNGEFVLSLIKNLNINPDWLKGESNEIINVKNTTASEKPAILQEIENTAVEATAPKFAEHENRFTEIEAELRELRALYEQKFKNEPPQPDTVSEPVPSYTADYEEPAEPEETEELPLAVNLAAGVPVEACDINETYPVPKKLIPNAGKKYCVAKINGTSMTEADIPDGSYVLLEYTDQPVNGKNMVVKYGSNTTLKLLHQTEQGSWELLYCDGSGAKIELKNGDWEVKGKFITVLPKKR